MKEGYQNPLKKSTLFLLLNPVPFSVQSYQEQKGPGTSDKLLFSLLNKFGKIPLLVIYLADQVWWFNIKQLLSYFKNYFCKFMQANSWHKLFHFHLSFCIWKVWKGREKIQKLEYLENEKSFLDEIKNTFHSFSRAIIWKNKKNDKK